MTLTPEQTQWFATTFGQLVTNVERALDEQVGALAGTEPPERPAATCPIAMSCASR